MLFKVLLTSLVSVQLADAFFPWVPEYRCILDDSCVPTKREAEVTSTGSVSFKLIQRLPKNDHPHSDQVNQSVSRLRRKYSSTGESETLEDETKRDSAGVVKRTNTYSIVTAATPTQTNSAGIDQDGTDFSYFAEVLLGTDSKPLYMLLDTGAGQSWVMGPDCTSAACATHNSFGAVDSTTFQAIEGSSFSLAYGSGSVSGTYGNDSLSIAGLTIPMTFGIADITSSDFSAFPMDGILGLSQATGTYPNFIQALVTSKSLQSNLFGVSINRASDGPNNGQINFGSPDTSLFSGSLSYNPVSSNAEGDWAIPMDGVGSTDKDAAVTGKSAYIDTGTSYIFAPADDVTKFHQTITGASSSNGQTWTVPCSTTTALTFTFSGVTYNVPSMDWVGPVANGVCTSNVYGQEVVAGQWLLGDTFLKNVYTVFDIDGNRIGFGSKSASSPSASTSSSSEVSSSSEASSSSGGNPSSTLLSTAAPSAATPSISGTTDPVTQTSNSGPAVTSGSGTAPSAEGASTTSGQVVSSETGTPGWNGHQSLDTTGSTSPASSASPTSTPTKAASSGRVEIYFPTILFAAFAAATFLL